MNFGKPILILCCLLAGCGQSRLGPVQTASGPTSRVQIVNATALPAPSRSDLFEPNRPYLIGPLDKLTIDVFGIPELAQKDYQIDASGRISFPLAGVVEAAGKTPAALADELEARLRARFIRNPQVTVNLRETVSQTITVDGQVRAPGHYPVVGRMTLMRAVASAQGLNENATQEDVVVFRTVGGQRMAALYNLKAIRRGTYDDPEVFANDIVVIGESQSRKLFRDALSVFPLLTTPLIIALQ